MLTTVPPDHPPATGQHLAALLKPLLLALLGVAGLIVLGDLARFGGAPLAYFVAGPAIVAAGCAALSLALLRRTRIVPGAWSLVAALLGVMAVVGVVGYGDASLILLIGTLPVALAALILGRRALLITLALGMALAFIPLARLASTPLPAGTMPPLGPGALVAALVVGTLALVLDRVRLTLDSLQQAAPRATDQERATALLDTLLAQAPVGMAFYDPDLRCVHINDALVAITGLSSDAHLGRTPYEVLPIELADDIVPLLCAVLEQGAPVVDRPLHLLGTPSRPAPRLTISMFPVQAADGRVLGVGAIVNDITAQLAAATTLRESEARYRSLVETAADVIIGVLPNGEIFEWNQEAERVFGWPRAEVHGQPYVSRCFPEELQAAVALGLQRVLVGEPLRDHEHAILTAQQRRRLLIWNMTPLRDSLGRVVAAILVGRDITQHKQLEAALAQAQKMESIGRLAGGVAHDFNNLMTAISGYTFLAQDALAPDHPAAADLAEIQRAAERATGVTRQLLAFARKQAFTPTAIDLAALLHGLEQLLHHLIGAHIVLRTGINGPATIHADRGQVEQLILNLAINARDAMPDGGTLTLTLDTGICARADASPNRTDVPCARLTVSDTGMGMPPDVLEHLFEPFFTTKPTGRGTGLGLAMCYGIVQQHGGTIACTSEPGRGTHFVIDWPLAAPVVVEPPSLQPPVVRVGGRERILLVEDEPGVRALAARVLRELGYVVVEAGDGVDALALAGASDVRADLLLTDAVMPRMGGYALAEELRARWPDLAVLVMSGYTPERHGRAVEVDAGELFLHKPFTPADLADRVRDALGSGRATAPAVVVSSPLG